MFKAIDSPFLVPFDGNFRVAGCPTSPGPGALSKKECRQKLEQLGEKLDELQRRLYAHDRYAILLIFQAMDAAGKDSTIRAVMRGMDPAGCQVHSFKAPSAEELDHDFLWRTVCRLPERGRIGVFNRSYYEETLIVRVHPELLDRQKLPQPLPLAELWQQRYESIAELERHLARNGTVILKFWLNISPQEQKRRFLSRLEEPKKNWKFSLTDVEERRFWPAYLDAYEAALAATSRPWAPWYAIPADDKDYMRLCVAGLLVKALSRLNLEYPRPNDQLRQEMGTLRLALERQA